MIQKRILAIGDIHGCLTALTTLARSVPFQPESDLLVTLGDYIDRGPDSKGVIDWLLAWEGERVSLRGNHEIMMMEARAGIGWASGWDQVGGRETLESYGRGTKVADVPDRHWEFLDSLVPYFETEKHFYVHASVYADLDLADQLESELYWGSFADPPPHKSGKTMVCGHTAQRTGLPNFNGNAVCIDTWVYGKGWLTCLDVERDVYWQANERGESRSGTLT